MRHHAAAHPLVRHHAPPWPIQRLAAVLVDRYLLLPIGAAIALVWANKAPEPYFLVVQQLAFPVNEIGMALFFALITQEIIEALMPGGALHSWRRWTLALVAAAGGVAGSTAVYLGYVNYEYEAVLKMGWPIATAVDVAAAYYTLKILLPRSGALPFALLVGIVTNVFGVLVVAPRYPVVSVAGGGVALIVVALGLAVLFRALKVRSFWPYLAICGTLSWIAFYREGLHPAFALVPIVPFLRHEPRRLDLFAPPPDDDATHHFEHEWNTVVQLVLFLFGFVNGGVVLQGYDTGTWATLAAALVGRPIGILVAVGAAVAFGLHLPHRIGWRELLVVALACSTGFTFALFFATGIVSVGPVLNQLKIGTLATVAGVALAIGAAHLLRVGRYAIRHQ